MFGLWTSHTLQETRYVHDSMNRPKIEFITYIYILYYQSSINFQISPNLAGFPNILHNGGFETAKCEISELNVMMICVQLHTNVSKQTTLLDGVDVGPPK